MTESPSAALLAACPDGVPGPQHPAAALVLVSAPPGAASAPPGSAPALSLMRVALGGRRFGEVEVVSVALLPSAASAALAPRLGLGVSASGGASRLVAADGVALVTSGSGGVAVVTTEGNRRVVSARAPDAPNVGGCLAASLRWVRCCAPPTRPAALHFTPTPMHDRARRYPLMRKSCPLHCRRTPPAPPPSAPPG